MDDTLYELLHQCTVCLVNTSSHNERGTGFFVAPGLVLTCAHVVEKVCLHPQNLKIFWNTQTSSAQKIECFEGRDLALVQVASFPNHPCVLLDEVLNPADPLYSYGYPAKHPDGDSATFGAEGWTKVGKETLLKFKSGQVEPGMSGAPLLNERTGRVCGMIALTRDRNNDLGGRAIWTRTIWQVIPVLQQQQDQFHKANQRWLACLKAFLSSPQQLATASLRPTWNTPIPPKPYYAHSYVLTRRFTGRHTELTALNEWANSNDTICVVEAIGGVGKSALTWHWVREYARKIIPRFAGVMWWSFYESNATMSNFVRYALAYTKQIDINELNEKINKEHEMMLLGILQQKKYLLVLDGIERILVAYHRNDASRLSEEQLELLDSKESRRIRKCIDPRYGAFLRNLVTSTPSKILISTRLFPQDLQDPYTQYPIPSVRKLSINGLSPQDALLVMRQLGIFGNPVLLKDFMNQFGYHPLLLNIIAGRILDYRLAPKNFDMWYDSEGRNLHLSELDLAQRRTHILQYALDGLKPELRKLLSQAAAFRYPIEYAALAALNPYVTKSSSQEMRLQAQQQFENGLMELENRALLQWDRTTNCYDFHPVVRAYAYEQLEDKDRGNAFIHVQDHFMRMPPENLNNIQELSDLRRTLEIYNAMISARRFEDASSLYQERLKHALETQLAVHYTIIELLISLFPNGIHQRPALSSPRNQSARINDLANAYRQVGDSTKAIDLVAQVLKIELDRNNIHRLCIALYNYQLALIAANNLSTAFHALELAYSLAERVDDVENLSFASLRFFEFYTETGQWKLAQKEYQNFRKTVLYRDAYWQVSAEKAYARLLIYQKQNSIEVLERAWDLAVLIQSRMDQLNILVLKGEAALQQTHIKWVAPSKLSSTAKLKSAINFFQEAVNLAQKLDVPLADYLGNLARAYAIQGQMDEAQRLIEQAINEGETNQNAAEVYYMMGKFEQAKEFAIQAYHHAQANGLPFSWHLGLQRAKQILNKLKIPEPVITPINQSTAQSIPYEWEIRTLIASKYASKYNVRRNTN